MLTAREVVSHLLVTFAPLVGAFLLVALQCLALYVAFFVVPIFPPGKRGPWRSVTILSLPRIFPALFWGAVLGDCVKEALKLWQDDKPREAGLLCREYGWRCVTFNLAIPAIAVVFIAYERWRHFYWDTKSLVLLFKWSFVTNMCVQWSLFVLVAGFVLGRSKRRRQVSERIRI